MIPLVIVMHITKIMLFYTILCYTILFVMTYVVFLSTNRVLRYRKPLPEPADFCYVQPLLNALMDCRWIAAADLRRPVSAVAGEEGRGA